MNCATYRTEEAEKKVVLKSGSPTGVPRGGLWL